MNQYLSRARRIVFTAAASLLLAGCSGLFSPSDQDALEQIVEIEADDVASPSSRFLCAGWRLSQATQAPVVDLLFASSGIEPEVMAKAEALRERLMQPPD